MRQGVRVIDSDTHVNPSLDVLLRYADRELKELPLLFVGRYLAGKGFCGTPAAL